MHPEHDYEIFHVAQKIKSIVSQEGKYREILAAVKESEAVIISFPLYYLLVHSGLKQFFEFVFECNDEHVFAGKYAAAISTSIHFYDNTAHTYVEGVCEDMGMQFVEGFSPGMQDFIKPEGRKQFVFFAEKFLTVVSQKRRISRKTNPVQYKQTVYTPKTIKSKENQSGRKVLVVADRLDENSNLLKMVQQFQSCFREEIEIAELSKMKINGSCLGCLKCGWDNTCAYAGKDDYIDFFRNKWMAADIIVVAGTVKDRFLSWEWKRFMDRNFWRTHSPAFRGQQIGMIISGPLSQLENIKTVFQGYFEVGLANMTGCVTDESGDSITIDQELSNLAGDLIHAAVAGYKKARTFLGVAGLKIFRDDIYSDLKAVFRADYKYYKKNRLFDFPQRKWSARILGSVFYTVMKISPLRKKLFGMIPKGMVMQHDVILKKLREKKEKQRVTQPLALQDAKV